MNDKNTSPAGNGTRVSWVNSGVLTTILPGTDVQVQFPALKKCRDPQIVRGGKGSVLHTVGQTILWFFPTSPLAQSA